MAHFCITVSTYGSNSALFAQLHTSFGYRIHGTIDYHALSTKKAGYGEPKQVVDINEQMLAHNSRRWFDPLLPAQITTWRINDDIRQQIHTYLDTVSSHAIIDDPRMSYTLPLWHAALTQAGHDITIVVPYQHPLTVAHRMHQQHHMSTRLALALWVAYTLAVETHSRTYRHIFVHHDAMMHDWQQTCQPIIDHIAPDGLPNDVITHINAYMHMLRQTAPAAPHVSAPVRALAIAELAHDVYEALQQPVIDATAMATFSQRLDAELTDPQYHHDIGQYDVIFNDIFLDTEARIQQQHSAFSVQIHQLYEAQSQKMTELYEKHGKYIDHQSQMFAETLTKHEHQVNHMRATFEQEIQHLNDKIANMQTEIDWRAQVTQQQQDTLNRLGWATRILALKDRITQRSNKS